VVPLEATCEVTSSLERLIEVAKPVIESHFKDKPACKVKKKKRKRKKKKEKERKIRERKEGEGTCEERWKKIIIRKKEKTPRAFDRSCKPFIESHFKDKPACKVKKKKIKRKKGGGRNIRSEMEKK
jgi:hypothetical protein